MADVLQDVIHCDVCNKYLHPNPVLHERCFARYRYAATCNHRFRMILCKEASGHPLLALDGAKVRPRKHTAPGEINVNLGALPASTLHQTQPLLGRELNFELAVFIDSSAKEILLYEPVGYTRMWLCRLRASSLPWKVVLLLDTNKTFIYNVY